MKRKLPDNFSEPVTLNLKSIENGHIINEDYCIECCGNPIQTSNKKLYLKITRNKIKTAKNAGVDFICTACTHCHMQYGLTKPVNQMNEKEPAPVFLPRSLAMQWG